MEKKCKWCGAKLVKIKGESPQAFGYRKYCNKKCRASYGNWQAKLKSVHEQQHEKTVS